MWALIFQPWRQWEINLVCTFVNHTLSVLQSTLAVKLQSKFTHNVAMYKLMSLWPNHRGRSQWAMHHWLSLLWTLKNALTYCIINEQDHPAAKECNRKLYYRQKLKKLFLCVQEWDFDCIRLFYYTCSKSSRGFLELFIQNCEKY